VTPPASARERPSRARLATILGTSTATVPAGVDMYLSAMPRMQTELNASAAGMQQTLAALFIGMAIAQLLFGPLSDHYGRKRPLLAGIALFTLAGVGCAVASSIEALVATRFLQALGGAAGMVVGRAVARDYFEGSDLARMFSLVMLVMGLAPILAPLIGSGVLLLGGWRAIFWVLAGYGLAVFVLVATGLRESLPAAQRASHGVGGSLGAMLRVGVDPRFLGYALAMAFTAGAMFAYIASSPFVFITWYGFSPGEFALLFGVNAIGLIGASQLNVRLLRRWSSVTVLRWALNAQLAGSLATLLLALSGAGVVPVLVTLFVAVACNGLIGPNAGALAMTPFGRDAGSASALMGTMHGALGALAAGVVGYLPGPGAVPMALMFAILVALAVGALAFVAPPAAARESPAAAK
jgi:DHA1 family bicyclomycin/chloramphenicol resistance-like MFS transporter